MVKIFSKKICQKRSVLRFLGIPLYEKKKISSNGTERRYLLGLLKSKKNGNMKRFYILGIMVYKKFDMVAELINTRKMINDKNKEIIDRLAGIRKLVSYTTNMLFAIKEQHSKIFPQFKNKNLGKTGVLVATGPTMLHYNKIKKAKHFCVNTAYTKIKPDYWFAIDGQNLVNHFQILQKTDFLKFYGQCATIEQLHSYISQDRETLYNIPDYIIENSKNGYKFYFDHPNMNVNRDIETQALPDLGSCVFSALQFAIYTGIKKIYVVGCDCAANGYFNGETQKLHWQMGIVTKKLLEGWCAIKKYTQTFHPDVEIISINPVGLKGMFKDVYTQSYLDANPELKEQLGDDIIILDEIEEMEILSKEK